MLLCEGVKANRSQRKNPRASGDEWMDGEGWRGDWVWVWEGGAEQYTEAIKRREKPCQNSSIVGNQFPSPQVRSEPTWQR